MIRFSDNRTLKLIFLLIAIFGVAVGVDLVQQRQEIRREAATLGVTVAPGTFSVNGNSVDGWVGKLNNSNNYSTNISVPQDTGYFIKFVSGTTTSGAVQVSVKKSDGTWTSWSPFMNGSQQIYAREGIATVDFSEWDPTPIGSYEAKFRINNADNPNSIIVNVTSFDTSDYFPFNPGNYYLLKNFSFGYWTRVDIEDQTIFPVNWNSKSKSITSNPLRFSMSSNNPWIRESTGTYDFRWFLSSGFDGWGIGNSKWALQSVFYSRSGSPLLKMRNGKYNSIFFPKNATNPPYYVVKKNMDLTSIYNETPMDSISTNSPFYGGTLSSSQIQLVYYSVGWRTSHRIIKVSHPKYSGPAMRIRFWEYDSGNGSINYLNSTSVNNDDWYFVRGLGLIGIDSQTIRGSKCSSNPTCAGQTTTMSNPQVSLRVDDIASFSNGENIRLQVGKNGSFSNLYSIEPGDTYQVKVSRKDGTPYNGFLEVLINGNRQVFKDIHQNPVWVTNGVGTIQTGDNQAPGDYVFSVRPYVYGDLIYTQNKELSSNNRLGWSSNVTVRLKPPSPTNTPTSTSTPKPTNTNTSTPTPSATHTPTPTPIDGDLNGNGSVDITDYSIFVNNFGNNTCGNTADITGDCKVNIFDYNILLTNFEK